VTTISPSFSITLWRRIASIVFHPAAASCQIFFYLTSAVPCRQANFVIEGVEVNGPGGIGGPQQKESGRNFIIE
jgi:hypothetical protein